MLHAREDYQRIQDPDDKIGEDEPVMLFRAQDRHMAAAGFNGFGSDHAGVFHPES